MDDLLAFDTETHLIQPGLLAPPLVCASIATANPGSEVMLGRAVAREFFRMILREGKYTLVGANIAFDFGVMAADGDFELLCLIFALYNAGKVYDVQIAQGLDAIAGGHLFKDPRTGGELKDPSTGKTGRYSLATCVDLVLGRQDAKRHDFWRLRYAILDRVPIEEWPPDATQYPKDDARNTIDVAVGQIQSAVQGKFRNLLDLAPQVRAAFALHLGAMWGLRTDPARVEALERKVEEEHQKLVERFVKIGFFKVTDDKGRPLPEPKENQQAIKRAVAIAYGADPLGECGTCAGTGKVPSEKTGKPVICDACDGTKLDIANSPSVPRTPGGGVGKDRDVKMESGDEDLAEFGDNEVEKIRQTYLPFVKQGTEVPINLRPNVIVATTRTSYDGLIQLIPRSGGVRDCFVARPGYVLFSSDYAALELCTLGQTCLWVVGWSRMAEMINETKDPGSLHTLLASQMIGASFDEMKKRVKAKDKEAVNFRQAAKAGNFGFPGGMGAAKLVQAKRKKSEGSTTGPDGRKYPGIRFCILIDGAQACGVEKVTEWKGRPTPPICKRCVEVVENILRPTWFKTFPEMTEYFKWVSINVDAGGELPCFGKGVERVRGGLDFCNGANNGFQGPAADGAKRALWLICEEAYTKPESPLFGTRPVTLIHDEIFGEMPEEKAYLAAPRLAELMVAGMREVIPDVHIVAEPCLMRHWSKDAEPVFDESGRLIPWMPKEKK